MSEPTNEEKSLKIASDIHKFDGWQGTARFLIGAVLIYLVTREVSHATVAIATEGKTFWELFFAWLPAAGTMFFGIYRFRRRLSKALKRFHPARLQKESGVDPNRESSNLLEDGTHPNDD